MSPRGSDWMTPLHRAEKYLGVRLVELERQLPVSGANSPLWLEYVQTVDAFARIRGQLYYGEGGGAARRGA